MGESKRRKETLGDRYGKSEPNFFGLTPERGKQLYDLTTRAAWIGIAAMVILWLTVRLIGPALGWWTLQG